MLGQIRQRLVVQGGQAATEERGATVREDHPNQLLGRDDAAEDDAAPEFRRERHENRDARRRHRGVGLRWAQERRLGVGRGVEQAGHFRHESHAVVRRIDIQARGDSATCGAIGASFMVVDAAARRNGNAATIVRKKASRRGIRP